MSRRPTPRIPHRRGHTRWLMIWPATVLALVVVGVIALEAAGPGSGPQLEPVGDLPPVAVPDVRTCTRSDETTIEEIRDQHRDTPGRITSTQVYACPQAFDHQQVQYAGEVVGELLDRRGGAWAHVNDDRYALEVGPLVGHRELDGFNSGLAVWLPDGLHETIDGVGRPGRRGDVLLIEGAILQADPHDGGGITLRAERVERVAESVTVDDPLHTLQAVVAAILALVAAAAVLWARRSR